MFNKADQSDQSIFDGAKRLLHGIPKIAAGIVGLSGFAYIIGWVYAQAYFSVFGAKWLITEIPILTLMGYSWWPVIVVLFFAYLGITDLAEIESKSSIEDSRRFKTTRGVLNYGRWVFIATIFADFVIGMIGYPALALILSFISVFIVVAMATSAFEILAFRLSKPSVQISLSIIYLTYAIIFCGIYAAPTQMGRNAALQDKAPENLSLPFVVLRDDPTKVFKLLMSSGERFYIFPTKYDAAYPPIQIVTASQIQSVQQRINKEIPK